MFVLAYSLRAQITLPESPTTTPSATLFSLSRSFSRGWRHGSSTSRFCPENKKWGTEVRKFSRLGWWIRGTAIWQLVLRKQFISKSKDQPWISSFLISALHLYWAYFNLLYLIFITLKYCLRIYTYEFILIYLSSCSTYL